MENKTIKLIKCSICKEDIQPNPINGWALGNNAQPLNDGRCCDDCDNTRVIPARIASYVINRERDKLKEGNK